MHPMMALAALRGCIAVRYTGSGGIRVAREFQAHARAIYDHCAPDEGLRDGLAAPSYYTLASLVDFINWDQVTEADIDWLCGLDT